MSHPVPLSMCKTAPREPPSQTPCLLMASQGPLPTLSGELLAGTLRWPRAITDHHGSTGRTEASRPAASGAASWPLAAGAATWVLPTWVLTMWASNPLGVIESGSDSNPPCRVNGVRPPGPPGLAATDVPSMSPCPGSPRLAAKTTPQCSTAELPASRMGVRRTSRAPCAATCHCVPSCWHAA